MGVHQPAALSAQPLLREPGFRKLLSPEAFHVPLGKLAFTSHQGRSRSWALGPQSQARFGAHGSDFLLALAVKVRGRPPAMVASLCVGCHHSAAPSPPRSISCLRDTTIFLPNFPAELTEVCEGQGACPASLSKSAKPLASGQGCRTLVPVPDRLTKGSFINNRNNRAAFFCRGCTP